MGAACQCAHLKLGQGVFQLKFIGVRPSPPPPLHLIMDSWKITTKFSNVSKTVTNLIWPLISKLYTMGFKFDHYKSHHRELRMLGLSGQVKDQLRTKSISRVSLFSSRWLSCPICQQIAARMSSSNGKGGCKDGRGEGGCIGINSGNPAICHLSAIHPYLPTWSGKLSCC